MSKRRLRTIWQLLSLSTIALSYLLIQNGAQAQMKQASRSSLQSGSYIYLGTHPGQDTPRLLTVDSNGNIFWQDTTIGKGGANQSRPSMPSIQAPLMSPFESSQYPVLKWRPKAFPSGGFLQLQTTYQDGGVQYIVTLFKVPSVPWSFNVDILDRNGFKLGSALVFGSDCHSVPGSNLLQARGMVWSGNEEKYKQAYDYSIK
ncbi:MAG: hypothetical protein K2X29_14940 [Candidatus Obscuribacterales bacterium]|nr:hypothetical protein [Candidatus Obscuribacterales bacterium]